MVCDIETILEEIDVKLLEFDKIREKDKKNI